MTPIGPTPKKPSLKALSPGFEYVDEYTQRVHDTCPLRYTNPEVINQWMKEQVPYKVTIGKAPLDLSDKFTGQKRARMVKYRGSAPGSGLIGRRGCRD